MPTSPLESALTSSCAIFRISLKTRHFNSIRINSYVFPRLKSFRISTYIKTPGGGGQQTPELSHAERANLLHSRHARSPQSRNRRPRLAPAGSWPENPWLPHGASCRGPCGAARVSRSRRFIHALLSCNSGGHFSRLGPSRETRAHGPEAHRRHRQHLLQRTALALPSRSAPPGRLPAQRQNSTPPQSRCFGSQACFRMLPESIARFSRPRVVVCRSRSHPCRLRTQERALPPLRLPARRHGNIRRITQAGRPTYYCPARQE